MNHYEIPLSELLKLALEFWQCQRDLHNFNFQELLKIPVIPYQVLRSKEVRKKMKGGREGGREGRRERGRRGKCCDSVVMCRNNPFV